METTLLERIMARKRLVAFVIGLLGIVIILLTILFRVDGLSISRLNLPSDNLSVGTDGTTLRAYNGAFFYKIDLTKDTDPAVLGGGVKLPEITHALWADDDGVLLNFDQSFVNTAVDDVARKENLSYTEKAQSTWYFDLSTDTLHHVGNYLLYSKAHYFDSKNSTLYYLEADEGLALHAFNTSTKQDSIIPLSITLDTINYVDKCYNSEKVCLVGKPLDNPTRTKIYSVADDSKMKEEFSADGELYPILGSSYGLILKNEDLVSATGDGVVPEYQKGSFTNLATGEEMDISERFTPNGAVYTTYGEQGDRLALIGTSNENYTTVKRMLFGPSTQSGRLKYEDGKEFTSAVVINAAPTPNSILIEISDGQYGIFAPKGYVKADLSVEPSEEVTRYAKTCTDKIEDARIEYDDSNTRLTLLLPDDQNFSSNVARLSDCVAERADLTYGYDIALTSYDRKSGRVTSY